MNYKICKVYNILDQMVSRCRGSVEIDKLNIKFKNANSSIELLQKIGDQNKQIGILMCFKYFKSMINKYFKISSKKKKLESLIDLNKLNEKLDTLSKKMEMLGKNIPFSLSSNKNASMKSFSINSNNNSTNNNNTTSSISDSVCAVHSPSQPHSYMDL
jgi:hypothetical protein